MTPAALAHISKALYGVLLTALLLLCSLQSHASSLSSPWIVQHNSPGLACELAAQKAERKHGLPRMLLLAIGMAESGKWHAASKSGSPWPWTVTSGGPGSYFPNRQAAIDHVHALKAKGVKNIDIGCFQINQHYHPDAFDSIEAGFEPDINADYAARFLKSLRNRHGTWQKAVAIYHSKTPARGTAYRQKVYSRLNALHVAEQKHRQKLYSHMALFRKLRHSYILAHQNYDRATGRKRINHAAQVFANNPQVTNALF